MKSNRCYSVIHSAHSRSTTISVSVPPDSPEVVGCGSVLGDFVRGIALLSLYEGIASLDDGQSPHL